MIKAGAGNASALLQVTRNGPGVVGVATLQDGDIHAALDHPAGKLLRHTRYSGANVLRADLCDGRDFDAQTQSFEIMFLFQARIKVGRSYLNILMLQACCPE